MDSFFIIAGLGNPGRKYDGSRHNVGFDVIDELVDRYHIGGPERFGKSMIGKGRIGDRKVILVKPLTYMNLSGEAIQEIVHFYKVDPREDLLVISDDIDLEAGRIRIRKKGSAGGHNGLKNIVQHLGTEEFSRIRSRIPILTSLTMYWAIFPGKRKRSWTRRLQRLRKLPPAQSRTGSTWR